MGKRSKFRGVSSHGRKWKAQINHAGTQFYLGLYAREEDAARAYDNAARVIHAHNAVVNFPTAEETSRAERREKICTDSVRRPKQTGASPAFLGLPYPPAAPAPAGPPRRPPPPPPAFSQGIDESIPPKLGLDAMHDMQGLTKYRTELQHRVHCLQASMQWIGTTLTPSSQDALLDELVVATILENEVSTRIMDLLRRQSPSSHTSSPEPLESSDGRSSSVQLQSSAESVCTTASSMSLEPLRTIELFPRALAQALVHVGEKRKMFNDPLQPVAERKMKAFAPVEHEVIAL